MTPEERLAYRRAYSAAHREEILSLIKLYNRDNKRCCDLRLASRFAKHQTSKRK